MKLLPIVRQLAFVLLAAVSVTACGNRGEVDKPASGQSGNTAPGTGAGNSETGATGGSATTPANEGAAATPGTATGSGAGSAAAPDNPAATSR